jgi:hypothetical protein
MRHRDFGESQFQMGHPPFELDGAPYLPSVGKCGVVRPCFRFSTSDDE